MGFRTSSRDFVDWSFECFGLAHEGSEVHYRAAKMARRDKFCYEPKAI